MSKQWKVELAICWQDGTWTTEIVSLDEGDLFLSGGDPSESEIWEAANDKWESEHASGNIKAHVATGLYAWQCDAHAKEEV